MWNGDELCLFFDALNVVLPDYSKTVFVALLRETGFSAGYAETADTASVRLVSTVQNNLNALQQFIRSH